MQKTVDILHRADAFGLGSGFSLAVGKLQVLCRGLCSGWYAPANTNWHELGPRRTVRRWCCFPQPGHTWVNWPRRSGPEQIPLVAVVVLCPY